MTRREDEMEAVREALFEKYVGEDYDNALLGPLRQLIIHFNKFNDAKIESKGKCLEDCKAVPHLGYSAENRNLIPLIDKQAQIDQKFMVLVGNMGLSTTNDYYNDLVDEIKEEMSKENGPMSCSWVIRPHVNCLDLMRYSDCNNCSQYQRTQ